MATKTKRRKGVKITKRTVTTKRRAAFPTVKQCETLEKRRASAKRAAARRQEKILLARVAKGQRGRVPIAIRTTAPGPWAVGPRGRKKTTAFKRTRVPVGKATVSFVRPRSAAAAPGGLAHLRKIYTDKELRGLGFTSAELSSRDPVKHYGYGWPADFAGHSRAAKKGVKRHDARGHDKRSTTKRDWRGQPIRHKRAAALGWQRRLAPRRPKNPTFFGKRPVKSSAKRDPVKHYGYGWPADFAGHSRAAKKGVRRHDARGHDKRPTTKRADVKRDWRGQPIRHKRAAALGWQRRLAPRRPKNPTFFGKRPVKSSAKRDPVKHYGYGWPADFAGHSRAAKKGVRRHDERGHDKRAADVKRDWRGQPIRHKRAAALGWQRRLSPRRPKNPTFFGKRPVKSSAKRDYGRRY